jgi:hypothetical protein
MHPIERLRYVARASGADQSVLVRETAGSLASLGFDPTGLVTACRRIIDRHLTSGPLWWLCGRVLCSGEPRAEAWRAVDEIEDDPTGRELAHALPDDAVVCVLGWPEVVADALVRRGDADVLVVDTLGEGRGLARRLARADVVATEVPQHGLGAAAAAADLVLLEASAIGPGGALCAAGSRAAAAVAHHAEVPVWLVGGVGRLLPARVWAALLGRWEAEGGDPWEAEDEVMPLDLVDRLCGVAGPEPVADGLRRVDCPIAPELFKPTAF